MPAPPTSFADLLRQSREANARTLREVAERLKVDVSLVSKWERGERKPNREEVAKLAKYLKSDPDAWVVAWLRDTVLYAIADDELGAQALKAAEAQMAYTAFLKQDRTAIVRKLKTRLAKFPKVKKAWLFGSFARKDDGPGSDIDLVIEVVDPFSYFELAEVQHQLEQGLGRAVDVGFMDSLKPNVLERITPDLQLIHAR
ncbi:MAG: nucleotidyltransferase domain-containing protein [Flavobacteriales bacterium]|jgi:predicted nucleotidyltransferase/plasmid maintenance system antidote protein VapI|nr:nucleotidyltransferase domain-containing protein [Flavobacteriales bacterium]MBK6549416.1 nucleotidyltransferase domain-containing protein [Flavobacteriales bacterium]MBK6883998.1 nucleotidyltransferase domain-containing protein [Flavobacteriales bacterium]MBK7100387.1 nucleotidyltransferase domain-containing protein [Flavobacteriales bacterium]MBK7481178.1 nucleotidyltransferase domain-containing protein [Flavobacteriales bacterium]